MMASAGIAMVLAAIADKMVDDAASLVKLYPVMAASPWDEGVLRLSP